MTPLPIFPSHDILPASAGNGRLLLVECDQAIARGLCTLLGEQFARPVDWVQSLSDCAARLADPAVKYDAAIIELQLPDTPVGAAIDAACAANVPVLVLTGNMSEAIYQQIAFRPVADYVLKTNPGMLQEVERALHRLLRNAGRHVLLVDESESFRAYLSAILHNQRLRVSHAASIAEALSVLRQHEDIALVITEQDFPDGDGIGFCAELRSRRGVGSLGIIGLTGARDPFVGVRFLKAGADDILRKPFLTEEFVSRINTCLDALDTVSLVRNQANRDFLTGLYNRRYLFEAGDSLFQNARRDNLQLAAAVIDIDYFKRINDRFGHDAGDAAIVSVASALASCFRATDLVARLGGEEFCVLAANPGDTQVLMERLRTRIEQAAIALPQCTAEPLHLTVSIGFTNVPGNSLSEMIKRADQAVYQAKDSGRNRVIALDE